ncbi:MAG: hypothetical protein LIQ31_00660 [Planctomycetes bacterium]|nr:hypothetical protein [Planctomycetota bacterium]
MTAETGSGGTAAGGHRPKYSAVTVVKAVVAALVVVWILSFIYGPIDHYSPLVYLNILIGAGMGMVVSIVVQWALRRHRIDGRMAALAVGLVAGLFAVWACWLGYLWVLSDYDFSDYWFLVTHPGAVFDIMRYLAENPMWSIGKSGSMPGIIYWIVWLAEAGALVVFPVKGALTFVRDNVLCIECNDWVAKTGKVAYFAVPTDTAIEVYAAFERNDLTPLRELGRYPEDALPADWIEVTNHACPNCPHLESYASVALVVITMGKNDKPVRTEKALVTYQPIDEAMEHFLFAEAPAAGVARQGDDAAVAEEEVVEAVEGV